MRKLTLLTIALMLFLPTVAREKIRINMGWKYQKGEVANAVGRDADDSCWETVNLPHDAAIYGDFCRDVNGGMNRNGYRPLGRGWYRKHLLYNSAWEGKRVILEFEGVYRDAMVYINGHLLDGDHRNGYLDFEHDITDYLQEGDNIIAVGYDNTFNKSSRWYNGEGIYRDVWLHIVDAVHVDRYGTYVTTPKITSCNAKVIVETKVRNDKQDSVLCQLVTEFVDPKGNIVAKGTAMAPFAGGETYAFHQEMNVEKPLLWDVGSPQIYTAISHIIVNGKETDKYGTPFGIREFEFTPEHGLLVNGRKVFLKGVCLHSDLGPLGKASFEAGWNRRLSVITKELGCNAIRLSHNCYPKYVLDWADRHGILVFDEFFDKWNDSYYGLGADFGDHLLRDAGIQICRDRNHPSVFIWSVGNETYEQILPEKTETVGVERLKTLVDFVHQQDPSRKVTVGLFPNRYGNISHRTEGYEQADLHQFAYYTDVVSVNYMERFFERDHQKYPQLIWMESEMATGELGYNYFNYDHSYTVGQFYWGGTEYIGESFGWPSKGWINGLIDMSNHLKPIGYSVKSFYNEEPMVKIGIMDESRKGQQEWNELKMTWKPFLAHWNFKEGEPLKVQVFSNCDETELFINGVSQGRKVLPPKNQAPEMVWNVVYQKGEIKAVGYKGGKVACTDILRTAGKPVQLIVEADADTLNADGLDLAYLNYRLVDKEGNTVPDDDRLIEFKVKGAAVNAGVDNGDITSDEPWQADCRTTYKGRVQLIIRSKEIPGKATVTAKVKGIKNNSYSLIIH